MNEAKMVDPAASGKHHKVTGGWIFAVIIAVVLAVVIGIFLAVR